MDAKKFFEGGGADAKYMMNNTLLPEFVLDWRKQHSRLGLSGIYVEMYCYTSRNTARLQQAKNMESNAWSIDNSYSK